MIFFAVVTRPLTSHPFTTGTEDTGFSPEGRGRCTRGLSCQSDENINFASLPSRMEQTGFSTRGRGIRCSHLLLSLVVFAIDHASLRDEAVFLFQIETPPTFRCSLFFFRTSYDMKTFYISSVPPVSPSMATIYLLLWPYFFPHCLL